MLYCCYMVFKISSKAGFFFIPLLFVLPPLIFRGDKTSKDKNSSQSLSDWNSHAVFVPKTVLGTLIR